MRRLTNFILILLITVALLGCKSKTIYVPVETVKTEKEYIDKLLRDSVYIQDSVIVNRAGDTIYVEKYKYVYKDKIIRDSVYITDSVKVEIPYPVIEIKEINKLKTWQILLMVLGGILIGCLGYRLFRLFK